MNPSVLFSRQLFQKETYELIEEGFVGLIAHGKVDPSLFVYNALCVRETEESLLAVVGAHAAQAHAAEAHFGGRKVNHYVIHAPAAELHARGKLLRGLFSGRKEIQRKRGAARIDIRNDLFFVLIDENG